MTQKCTCEEVFGNTGIPPCELIADVTVKNYMVKKYADDGTRNSIPSGQIIDQAYITGRINDPDQSKRWYPLRSVKNVTDERADPTTESLDGVDYITEEGSRVFKGFTPKASAQYLENISKGSCGEFATFNVDKQNRIWGEEALDGSELYPLAIEPGTYWTRNVNATSSTVQKVEITFTYSELLSDGRIRAVIPEDDVDLVNEKGLLTVLAVISSVTSTGFTAVLNLQYGAFDNKLKVTGWVDSDFVFEDAAGTPVAITSVTPTENSYDFVFATQPPGDYYLKQANPNKDGYELFAKITIV